MTIAGSDSGGTGIQADLKTIEAQGAFGTTASTSVRPRTRKGVKRAYTLLTEDVRA